MNDGGGAEKKKDKVSWGDAGADAISAWGDVCDTISNCKSLFPSRLARRTATRATDNKRPNSIKKKNIP